MTPLTLLDPRLWLALLGAAALLVGGGYAKGRTDGAKAERIERELQEGKEAFRRLEKVAEANNALQKEKVKNASLRKRAAAAATAAGSELERLRAHIAVLDARAAAGGARPGADGGAAVARELLLACAAEYTKLAEEAGGLSARLSELQGYTRVLYDTCQKR